MGNSVRILRRGTTALAVSVDRFQGRKRSLPSRGQYDPNPLRYARSSPRMRFYRASAPRYLPYDISVRDAVELVHES